MSDVIQRVLRTYNKKFASRDPQTLKQIDKLFEQEICLPIGYEESSVIEELEREFREQIRLETQAASAVQQIEPVLLNQHDFYRVYLEPRLLASMKNSFSNYRRLGGSKLPTLKLKREADERRVESVLDKAHQ